MSPAAASERRRPRAARRRPRAARRLAREVLLAHRLDAGAQPVGLALELVQAAAVVAGQALGGGALDGQAGELLADGVGAALDLLDALQRGGELGAGGLALTLAVALEALERRGELLLGGLRLLLVLGAQRLELGGDVGAGEAGFEAAGGLGDRLDGARLGGGDGLGQAAVGQRLGGRAVALQLIEAGGQARVGGLGGSRARSRRSGRAPGAPGGRAARGGRARTGRSAARAGCRRAARRPGAGLGGALLGVAAGLVELGGQAAGDALELVDALDGAEQARDDRGGVVEVAEVALDARVGVREALLGLGVLRGALGLAAGQLLLDPRGRLQRAEDDERAGGAPALPRLRVGLDRGLQRADDDRVLLAHAQQHQVQRQLEGQVLEEEREVEALVELDRDEDGLHRELAAVAAAADRARRCPGPAAARRGRGTRARPGRRAGSCRRSASRRSSA